MDATLNFLGIGLSSFRGLERLNRTLFCGDTTFVWDNNFSFHGDLGETTLLFGGDSAKMSYSRDVVFNRFEGL